MKQRLFIYLFLSSPLNDCNPAKQADQYHKQDCILFDKAPFNYYTFMSQIHLWYLMKSICINAYKLCMFIVIYKELF